MPLEWKLIYFSSLVKFYYLYEAFIDPLGEYIPLAENSFMPQNFPNS